VSTVGNFILIFKTDEMLFCTREKRLLFSLYMFVCRFASVVPISRISVKEHLRDFHESLLGKTSLVKIGPNVLLSYLENLRMAQCSLRHYIAIKALPSKEAESVC
jgi:hypothetical protein